MKRKLSKNYVALPPVEDSELMFQLCQFEPPNGIDHLKVPLPGEFYSKLGGDKSIENSLRKALAKLTKT